jgi:hypothetical protein
MAAMRRWALLAAVLALACAGCGTNEATSPGTADKAPKQRADGRLAVDPAPLTFADIERRPAQSAERAVIELLFWAQWGSTPNLVAAYDPVVREALSTSWIGGAYAMRRPAIAVAQPKVERVEKTDLGTVVTLRVLSRAAPPALHSFTLRRRGAYWRVVHDTFLEDALAAYVQTINDPDPQDANVPLPAFKAGIQASRRYRDLFTRNALEQVRREREARATPAATATPQASPSPDGG